MSLLLPVLMIAAGFGIGFYFLGFFRTAPRPIPAAGGPTVTVGTAVFRVDVADTVVSRAQGLSGRESLAADEGMLFIFGSSSTHGFWMKDMKFAIDIVWLREAEGTFQIAGISKNAVPEPGVNALSLKIYYPPEPVRYVLEVPSGTADTYAFETGDEVAMDIGSR